MKTSLSGAAVLSALCALCLATATATADDDDARGFMLSSSCAACHGPDGNSPDSIPSLNGKSSDYITKAMQAFRSDERPATVMNRLAKGYSDDEIARIANWFAARR